MKDREMAKAVEALLEAGDRLAEDGYAEEVENWHRVADTARGILKVRQDRDDRARKYHTDRRPK